MPADWSIRRAVPDDAAALAHFGRAMFDETFGAVSAPEDTAAYLAATFGPSIQRAEIERRDAVTLVVEAAGELVGYAFVETADAPSPDLDRPVRACTGCTSCGSATAPASRRPCWQPSRMRRASSVERRSGCQCGTKITAASRSIASQDLRSSVRRSSSSGRTSSRIT